MSLYDKPDSLTTTFMGLRGAWMGLWRALILAALVGTGSVAWQSVETLVEVRTELRLMREQVTRQLENYDERLRYLERESAYRPAPHRPTGEEETADATRL